MNEMNNTNTDPGLGTVTCVNCDLTGLIGFYGILDLETSLKGLKVAEVQRAFIGVEVVESISARLRIQLEFTTSESAAEFAFQHSIFTSLGEERGNPTLAGGVVQADYLNPLVSMTCFK